MSGLTVYFTVADESEMPSKKHLIAPAHSLPEKQGVGEWGWFRERDLCEF